MQSDKTYEPPPHLPGAPAGGSPRIDWLQRSLARHRDILTDVPVRGLTIAGTGVGAGVVFGVVSARGIGRYVTEVHLPGLLSFIASELVILAAAVIAFGCARRAHGTG